MKRKLFILGLLCLSINLFAQHRESENVLEKLIWDDEMLSLFIDTRLDLQTNFQDGQLDYAGFRGQTLRLWIAGEITPGIRYRVRHRFNKPQEPLIRDNYSGATDQAWLAFDIKKDWTITAGKQAMQMGTFEYDYSGADLYLVSMINGDLDMYKTGINVAYRFAKQEVNLQVVNSDAPQFASEEYKNKSFSMNALWYGKLFNDVLQTRIAYSLLQHNKTKFYHWLTAGVQINTGKFISEYDYYLGNRNMDYGSIVNNNELGPRYVNDQSASVNLKYLLDKWHFSLKGVWDQRYDKELQSTAYNSWGAQAAAEFYPFSKPLLKGLRFHAAYVYQNTAFKGNYNQLDDKNTHQLIVGTRWLFKAK